MKHKILFLTVCLFFFGGFVLISSAGCNGIDPGNTSPRAWGEPTSSPGYIGNSRKNR